MPPAHCIDCIADECLIEVLRWLEVHELLAIAFVCRRWQQAIRDESLWQCTRFGSCGASLLQRHFRSAGPSVNDHSGTWTRCTRALDGVSFMCRSVELDYVDKGEGVCYRLLRSVSCLQQLHHPHIVPLKLINLDTARNEVRVLKYAPPRYDAPPRAHGQLSLFTASAGSEWGENVWSPQILQSRSASQPPRGPYSH